MTTIDSAASGRIRYSCHALLFHLSCRVLKQRCTWQLPLQ